MHSDPALFTLTAASSLDDVLQRLTVEPGRYTPLAGGTELMVAFNSGRLLPCSLISIQALSELRFIHIHPERISIGAGSTFADLRRDAIIAQEFPLLAQAASWTGSIANQNRGTLGGNICNASPAADTPPVLLAYDAEITLVSAKGERSLLYRDFHLSYKRTALRSEELVYSVSIPRRFSGWKQCVRKVGARNAQAVSKTALACVARIEGDCIAEVFLGAASLADRPTRLYATELALTGQTILPAEIDMTIRSARAALAREAKPIDDIRSTARYRLHVAANLVEDFVRSMIP